MPSTSPAINTQLQALAKDIGTAIRVRRKQLKVTAIAAAEAAGMSRVTWHRIEKGEISVTLGAYLSAANAVGLTLGVKQHMSKPVDENEKVIPVQIVLDDFPQLKQIAWQAIGVDTLTPREALDIYDRNWRYIDVDALTPKEQRLIDALRVALSTNVDQGEIPDGDSRDV